MPLLIGLTMFRADLSWCQVCPLCWFKYVLGPKAVDLILLQNLHIKAQIKTFQGLPICLAGGARVNGT